MSKYNRRTLKNVVNTLDDDIVDIRTLTTEKKKPDVFRNKLLQELKEAETRYDRAKADRHRIKQLIKSYDKHLKNITNTEKKKNTNKSKSGFNKPVKVPDKLADYIGIERNTILPRTKVTSKLYRKLIREKKYYTRDKRVLRADLKIREIFGLPESVNTNTDPKDKNGFNFYNLQTHIANYYKKHVVDEDVDDDVESESESEVESYISDSFVISDGQ